MLESGAGQGRRKNVDENLVGQRASFAFGMFNAWSVSTRTGRVRSQRLGLAVSRVSELDPSCGLSKELNRKYSEVGKTKIALEPRTILPSLSLRS